MTKERLKAYKDMKKEHRDLERRIAEIDTKLQSARSQRLDGMPRGGSGENYVREELLDTKTELLKEYQAKEAELAAELLVIEQAIDTLEPRERLLMRLHYIDGQTWEQVCISMTYSWTQVHRIHGAALKRLREKEEAENAKS